MKTTEEKSVMKEKYLGSPQLVNYLTLLEYHNLFQAPVNGQPQIWKGSG
jgi:hypothetical protein